MAGAADPFFGMGSELQLSEGETLFSLGDAPGFVYQVLDGCVEIIVPSNDGEVVVARQTAGALVGEVTGVVGGRRTATARAAEPSNVRQLDQEEFDQWLAAHPAEAETLAAMARTRVDRTRVTRVLVEMIGNSNPEVMESIVDRVGWQTLAAGETLFHQGDAADAAYIVVAGRLQVVSMFGDIELVNVELGRGEVVGELGIIEDQPRSASVYATRETTMAVVGRDAFEELTTEHPALMLQLFRRIVARALQTRQTSKDTGSVAVAVLAPEAPADLGQQLAAEVDTHGTMIYLDRPGVDQYLSRRGIVDAEVGTVGQARLSEFLHEAEVIHRFVILAADDQMTTWTKRVLGNADRVVLVVSAFPDKEEERRIQQFLAACRRDNPDTVWLARLHAPSISMPTGSAALMERLDVHRVVHLKRDDPASTARLARLMTGNGVGLALAGGGARGFAHLGALRALSENDVVFDAVAGTSMGSVVAGFIALGNGHQFATDEASRVFAQTDLLDYTVPVVSLLKGEGLWSSIDQVFGRFQIEDLWLPYRSMCVNITQSRAVEHAAGPLGRAIRASVSLPGIFPPVVEENGDLLVDGGVLENLPVSGFLADSAIGSILGITVAPPEGPRAKGQSAHTISGIEALRTQMSRRKASYPALAQTVMGSMLVGSSQALNSALGNGDLDLHLSLNLQGVALMDFSDVRGVADRGYADALPQVQAWLAQRPPKIPVSESA